MSKGVNESVRSVALAGPNPDEVATGRLGTRGREFGAVGLEKCLVAGPVLCPPDAVRALEDRASPAGFGSGMMGA